MSLTDMQIRKAKPKDKPYKMTDGDGMFLLITPSGGKLWRLKYRIERKEKLLSFGAFPEVSLLTAREKRAEARKLLANGVDPSEAKKQKAAEKAKTNKNTFQAVALEWFAKTEPTWCAGHADIIMGRLKRDVFPVIGDRPISQLKPRDVLGMLQNIELRGAVDTAHRIKVSCSQVFRYAIASGKCDTDPTLSLKGALAKRRPTHYAAITDPKQVATLLRSIDAYEGTFVVRQAMRLAPLVFVRPGELRHAEWSEINLETAEWNIPAEKMKTRQPHLVPLSSQAVEILKELHPLTGTGRYVFPGRSSNPMSENALNASIRYLGYDKETMTGHGFRAMARTLLDEVLQVRPDIIEHQLAHCVKDPLGRAYNRTSFIKERRKMMQQWADYLDGLKSGAKVIPLRKAGGE
jgi:integrase